jgi:putative ABC transport system permease protein
LWDTLELQALTTSSFGLDASQILATVPTQQESQEIDQVTMRLDEGGQFGDFTALAIPLALGDFFGPFRVVGTTPAMFNDLRFGEDDKESFQFAEGRNFELHNEKNGYFEAVVGHSVAEEMGVGLGDHVNPTHGAEDGSAHAEKFTIVGVLEKSDSPHDRAVFVNLEGFFLMDNHSKVLEESDEAPSEEKETTSNTESDSHDEHERLPLELREVTAVLVKWSEPIFGATVPGQVNEGGLANSMDWSEFRPQRNQISAQAVSPVAEIHNLFNIVVEPIKLVLLGMTVMICIVSGIGILVSIYNSMSDRKHEIAVMRALGAGRGSVMSVILFESIILSIGGGLLGWIAAHAIAALASSFVESQTGVTIAFWDLAPALDADKYLGDKAVALTSLILGAICGLLVIGGLAGYLLDSKKNRGGIWQFLIIFGVVLSPLFLLLVGVSLEIVLIPGLVVLAVLVGLLPAASAYRTDVAKSLGA